MKRAKELRREIALTPGTLAAVAKRFGCSSWAVSTYRREFGVGTRQRHRPDELRREIAEAPGSLIEVAERFGCSYQCVQHCRKAFGIQHPDHRHHQHFDQRRRLVVADNLRKFWEEPDALERWYMKRWGRPL